MIMICGFIIGFAVAYIVLDVYVVKPYAKDYADLVLKSGKEYAAKMEIISRLLKDRESVRDLLLDLGVIKWDKKETIDPGEIVVIKRHLVAQKDSEIINSLLKRRKRLRFFWIHKDLLTEMSENDINECLCRWPEYMEDKQ